MQEMSLFDLNISSNLMKDDGLTNGSPVRSACGREKMEHNYQHQAEEQRNGCVDWIDNKHHNHRPCES
jgi:hypothetical protein